MLEGLRAIDIVDLHTAQGKMRSERERRDSNSSHAGDSSRDMLTRVPGVSCDTLTTLRSVPSACFMLEWGGGDVGESQLEERGREGCSR